MISRQVGERNLTVVPSNFHSISPFLSGIYLINPPLTSCVGVIRTGVGEGATDEPADGEGEEEVGLSPEAKSEETGKPPTGEEEEEGEGEGAGTGERSVTGVGDGEKDRRSDPGDPASSSAGSSPAKTREVPIITKLVKFFSITSENVILIQ
jgi:hypothetical protein